MNYKKKKNYEIKLHNNYTLLCKQLNCFYIVFIMIFINTNLHETLFDLILKGRIE